MLASLMLLRPNPFVPFPSFSVRSLPPFSSFSFIFFFFFLLDANLSDCFSKNNCFILSLYVTEKKHCAENCAKDDATIPWKLFHDGTRGVTRGLKHERDGLYKKGKGDGEGTV